MAYKGNWATGDLIDTTAFQELVNSAVYSFASLSALTSAISTPVDGQIAFAQDTELYYRWDADSSAWTLLLGGADITAVTITTASDSGLAGGTSASGGSFSATLTIDINGQSSVTATVSDEMMIADVSSSNAIKKITLNDLPISSATQTALDNITAGTSTLTIPIEVKIADDGSGSQNVFYLLGGSDTGAGTKAPSLDLAVGFKYKFDISDSSNAGHPLKFSITKDGTHASGSEFTTNVTTNGTAGSSGAYVILEITPETMGASTIAGAGTPTLYPYCPNHSGMGGEAQYSLFGAGSGSADALTDGDSDFTLLDGMTNGIHYELDNTDVADWNNAGVQLKADGGIFHNTFTQSQNYTIASGTGAMAVGGLSFSGTVTISGTLVVL